jgi:hypothetical protein
MLLTLGGQKGGEPVINSDAPVAAARLRLLEPAAVRLRLFKASRDSAASRFCDRYCSKAARKARGAQR